MSALVSPPAGAARALLRLALASLLTASALACASSGAVRPTLLRQPDGSRLIPADVIAQYGSVSVWEVLRKCDVGFRLQESASGMPIALSSRRGRSSILLDETPVVVLDGVRLLDSRVLYDITASSVASIRVLSGIDGTTFYGTNSGAGVIIITTKRGPDT
jgi:outer membrane receptor protein involved in Fe transport